MNDGLPGRVINRNVFIVFIFTTQINIDDATACLGVITLRYFKKVPFEQLPIIG
jgi:hypothetical protein